MTKDEMQKLLVLRDVQYRIDDSFYWDYFTLQIMVLLNKGLYSRKKRMPGGLKTILLKVLRTPDKEVKNELNSIFNALWDPIPADILIEDVVESLTFQYLYQNRSAVDPAEVEKIISSFLLVKDKELTRRISQKVFNKMEGVHA